MYIFVHVYIYIYKQTVLTADICVTNLVYIYIYVDIYMINNISNVFNLHITGSKSMPDVLVAEVEESPTFLSQNGIHKTFCLIILSSFK